MISEYPSTDSTFCKGYAFAPDGSFMNEEGVLHYLSSSLNNKELLIDRLKQLNGVFSLALINGPVLYLYCDKSRFFPLFFRLHPEIAVSDDPYSLIQEGDRLSVLSSEEFRRTGFTTGCDTLIDNIMQTPPGELLIIGKEGRVERHRIFSYRVKQNELRYDADPVSAMHVAIEKAAGRFIQSIGKATPVLPLSGGYDSRLIACILKKYGYSNTICFTFGRKTREVDISEKVAKLLKFTWHFIDYETIEDPQLSPGNEVFHKYCRFASALSSMFYLQEYPAVLYLIGHDLIPDDSVFLPGHSGDLLGGSQFVKVFSPAIHPNKIASTLLSEKFIWYPFNRKLKKMFLGRLNEQMDFSSDYIPYSIFEDWDIRGKIAGFIINSSRVFTFFGYQTRFFFWDDELMEFFRCLPPEQKIHKHTYNQCLKENYFAPYKLNFENELVSRPWQVFLQKIKNRLKPFLPYAIRYTYICKNDWACYEKLTRPLWNELSASERKHLPYNGFNSVIINWYLKKVEEWINSWACVNNRS